MKSLVQKVARSTIRSISRLAHIDLLSLTHKEIGLLDSEIEQNGESKFLKKLGERIDAPLVLDVGANKGEYARYLLSVIPKAKVHCFEPNIHAFDVLKENAGVKSNNFALGTEAKKATLYIPTQDNSSTHSAFNKDALFRKSIIREQEVTLSTLEAYCSDHDITSIDLLKIDTEGHEMEVLLGGKDLLPHIKYIQFEMNYHWVFNRIFLRDFYELLPGFHFYRITERALVKLGPYDPVNEIFQMHNLLAIRDSELSQWNNLSSW